MWTPRNRLQTSQLAGYDATGRCGWRADLSRRYHCRGVGDFTTAAANELQVANEEVFVAATGTPAKYLRRHVWAPASIVIVHHKHSGRLPTARGLPNLLFRTAHSSSVGTVDKIRSNIKRIVSSNTHPPHQIFLNVNKKHDINFFIFINNTSVERFHISSAHESFLNLRKSV